jgi:hypothetical protein
MADLCGNKKEMIWYFTTLWANIVSLLHYAVPISFFVVPVGALCAAVYRETVTGSPREGTKAFLWVLGVYAIILLLTSPFWKS